ncbi:MAG: SgcJ/EcaC family oxidoreductase [Deltaproteobacteria bacterium]|nr:SgcJ/EcaC family oxidoreductase [Deltaproteobacteria bacterium]
MKKRNLNFSILLFLSIILFGCAQKNKDADVEADMAAINELYKQATLAFSTGDAELYLALLTEDVVAMATEFPAITGKEELRPIIEGLFGMFDLQLPYTIEKIEVSGNNVFVRSIFQYSMTPKAGGETTTRAGKQLDIIKRQADGSWKIYIQSWSYNAPIIGIEK